jgi:hypothetical protein
MIPQGRLPRALLMLAGAVLVVHSLAYNFVTDDAYISFVYARNFAEHGELTFNLGDRVEGYTNFLWTFVLGVLMKIGITPELSSRVLGTVCGLATLVLAARIAARALGPRIASAWASIAAIVLALSAGFACWSSGGLETQLFTMLVVGALDALVVAIQEPTGLRRAAVLLALASMTRPEGPLVAAVLGVVWIGQRLVWRKHGGGVRHEFVAAAWFVALWAPWFAWRWWYYGYPFPNTYYVKAAGEWRDPSHPSQMLAHGVHYVWTWFDQTGFAYVLPVAGYGLFADRRRDTLVLAAACVVLLVVYGGYAASVGGDFMGLHRFIMPLTAIAAICVALGVARLATTLGAASSRPPIPALVVLGTVVAGGVWFALSFRSLGHARFAVAAGVGAACLALVVWRFALVPRILPVGVLGIYAASQFALSARSLDPDRLAADRGVIDTPAFLIVYTEDRAKIGRALAPCMRDDDFSIVGGAGAQPYFARMRAIDVFGLVSSRIAHEEPRTRPRAGHTKWGSPPLLASYDPTFVFSSYAIHKTPTPPPRLDGEGFWLARGYERVTMRVEGLAQQGKYYTFLVKRSREFTCPGRIR